MKIIFAQGNPEPEYTSTRHNIGFSILNKLADSLKVEWIKKTKFNSFVAETKVGEEKVLLVKPNTYYNETGVALRKITDFYKINICDDLLVIHDDLNLPFGSIRVRNSGSDGGNNGVKSINDHVGKDYPRIRIGISNSLHNKIDDADFVLSKLNAKESKYLKESLTPKMIDLIEQFCNQTLVITSYKNID